MSFQDFRGRVQNKKDKKEMNFFVKAFSQQDAMLELYKAYSGGDKDKFYAEWNVYFS